MSNSNANAVNVRTDAEIATGTDLDNPSKVNKNESAIASIVALASATLDPKDMLKKYEALGSAFLKHARWQKSQFKAWDKSDYDRLAGKIEDEVKLKIAINDIRMDTYVRVAAFLDAVRPFAPLVDRISYYQIANKFLPMLTWSKVDLEGEIRKEWIGFLTEIIAIQTSDNPLKIKELDRLIEERKVEITRESNARRDPEKALAAEQRAANAKIVAKRQSAVSAIGKAIGTAIGDGSLDGKDIADTIASVAKAHNVVIPAREVAVPTGFDPVTCTIADIRVMMAVLLMNGKADEIRTIADISAKMVQSLEIGNLVVPIKAVA